MGRRVGVAAGVVAVVGQGVVQQAGLAGCAEACHLRFRRMMRPEPSERPEQEA